VACVEAHMSGTCVTPKQHLKYYSCGGNHTTKYRGYRKWEEDKIASVKRKLRAPVRRDGVSTRMPEPKSAPPTSEQEALGTDWDHGVRGGRIFKTIATSPTMSTTNFGLGSQSEHKAAHLAGPCTTSGPESPAMKFQTSRPNNADSTVPPSKSHL
jgi:hypothetical protein